VSESCLFCRIARKEIASSVVYEDEDVFAFNDINPQAPTHVLVVPKSHVATLDSLGADNAPLAGRWFAGVMRTAAFLGLGEYRVVVNNGEGGGQVVFHVHFHLLSGRRFTWPPG
jgi:histidine triad (HIT) family protein